MPAETRPGQPVHPFYFVFGTRYGEELHPVFSTTDLPDHWVTVEAPDEDTARRIMTAISGTQWSRCLDRMPNTDHFPKGELQRYHWGTPSGSQPQARTSPHTYGDTVEIGHHRVTSWPARIEDGALIHDAAVQIEFRGIQTMVYASVMDGRTVVETELVDAASQYRIVADGIDPVYSNYLRKSED